MFESLPGELYSAIIQELPEEDFQWTMLALTRALPFAPISVQRLFQRVRLKHPAQAVLLHRKLRQKNGVNADGPCNWVEALSIQDWMVDADVVLNIVNLLPNLQSLDIWIGANNFSPEHLEGIFEKPLGKLRFLGLRFRPYVQRANYYQFLKGAYFDSTLVALSRWPEGQIPALSIIQDPINATMELSSRQAFAQPLVFFKLDPSMAILLQSPTMVESLTAFRLRIPGRPVVRSLCLPAVAQVNGSVRVPELPSIEILDLSTCGVLEGEVDMILSQFQTLKHFILDDCPILRGELREGEWAAMGKRCALVGVRRAKEREKTLKAALEIMAVQAPEARGAQAPRRMRRGRRGLSTATISFRDRPTRPGGEDYVPTGAVPWAPFPKTRLLPPLPSLKTLCTTVSAMIDPKLYPSIRAEFEAGWAEGIAVLAVTRARLRESAKNGVQVVRFSAADWAQSASESSGSGTEVLRSYPIIMRGLEKVEKFDLEAFAMPISGDLEAPILCFAGQRGVVDHAPGCGHSVAQAIWRD